MTLHFQQHDVFFRALARPPHRATALIRDHLSPEIASLIDFEHPPVPQEGSFIEGEGVKTQCDSLFRVRLKGEEDAYAYVLFEHKSSVDPGTPVQLARYMLNIWAREMEAKPTSRELPMIFPIVFYHGRGQWTVPLSLGEMIKVPEGVVDPLQGFAYRLRDLGRIDPGQLSQDPEVRAGLLALAFAFKEFISPEQLDLITGGPVDRSEFETYVLMYSTWVLKIEKAVLEASIKRTKPERWENLMGTLAETWIAQGIAQGIETGIEQGIETGIEQGIEQGIETGEIRGIEKGIEKGKAETFLRLARLKFGTLPEARVTQVHAAGLDQLDAWLDSLLLAANLDDVFDLRSRH